MKHTRHLLAAVALLGLSIGIATADMESDTDSIDGPNLIMTSDPPVTPAEPTPDWAIDLVPETGAAAELPGPGEAPATAGDVEPGSNEDLRQRLDDLKTAYDARTTATSTAVGWAGVVAALAWLIIVGLKRLGSMTTAGKRILPLVALGLGILAGILAEVAGGLTWWQAAVVGGGGPLSVFLHELVKGAREVRS
jgi:hypothetical protein